MLELWSLTVEKLEEKVSTIDNLTLSLKFVHLFVCLLEGKGIHRTFYLCTAFELLKSATQQEHQTLIVEFQIKARKDRTRLDRGIRFSDWDVTSEQLHNCSYSNMYRYNMYRVSQQSYPLQTEQCADYM